MNARVTELAAAADELNALRDGAVQKAWATHPLDCVLSVRKGRQTVLVRVVAHASLGRVSVVDERPRLDKGPPGLQFVLRKELVGARLDGVAVAPDGRSVELTFTSERGRYSLRAAFAPPTLVLSKLPAAPPVAGPVARREAGATLEPASLSFPHARELELALESAAGQTARAVETRVERADLVRLKRTIARVEADVAKTLNAEQLRIEAELLVSQQHLVKRGATQVTLSSFAEDGTVVPITIALDPARSTKENVERRFHQYRRMKRGAAVAAERLAALRRELAEREQQLEAPPSGAEGPGGAPAPRRREAQPRALPYHEFRGDADAVILVGRGARANDALTLKVAHPHDYWLHARGTSGAHVVLRCEKGQVPTPQALADAAMLAAHHSTARAEAKVEVSYTPARFVRKPKGAPPGSVVVEREKTMLVRLEAPRLTELLASRRAPRE